MAWERELVVAPTLAVPVARVNHGAVESSVLSVLQTLERLFADCVFGRKNGLSGDEPESPQPSEASDWIRDRSR